MNIFKKIYLGLLILSPLLCKSQNNYVLDLKPEKWNINPEIYWFNEIKDDRIDKKNAGKILSGNNLVKVDFKKSLSSDIKKIIESSVKKDTSLTEINISVERFSLTEIGNISDHKLVLDFSIKFYRMLNDKSYLLFESKGKPEFKLHGNFPGASEKIIIESLKNVFLNFNEWINQNSNIPTLANKVQVFIETDFDRDKKGDTIIWSKNYKLSWDDFKGRPPETNFMALSNCIFSYKAQPVNVKGILNLNVRLYACFDKRTSWVKQGQKKDVLLAHEQLHFDICELYVRLLRKKISEYVLDPMEFDKQINKLFEEVWEEYQLEQQKYDDETGHGIISDKQLKWQEKVQARLKLDVE